MTTAVHPFEQAGLGKAPFRYLGAQHQDISYGARVIGHVDGVAVTTSPGGTCDYCGRSITNIFRIGSADGREFSVGCECVRKTGDARLSKQVDAAIKTMKRARDAARIKTAQEKLATATLLTQQPHPNAKLAAKGLTLADYCGWLLNDAGMHGKLEAAKLIERATS